MKTATVRQLRNQFPAVLRLLRNGESVAITSRRKIVATLAPPRKRPSLLNAWMDAETQFAGTGNAGLDMTKLIAEDREV